MKDVPITKRVTVTLRVGDWFWILGLLSTAMSVGQNEALDSLYDQIMRETA